MKRTKLQKIAFCTLTAGVLAASQSVVAHTTLQIPSVVEGANIYNNAQIGHGCGSETGSAPVIANSIVFPDGTDSTVAVNGAVVDGATTDQYLNWGGQITNVPSNDIFEKNAVNCGVSGVECKNPVGNYSWKGRLAPHGTTGLVPLRIKAAFINEFSCAKSVKLKVAIADICKITKVTGFSTPGVVNFWTPFVEGSLFNRPDSKSEAANFTITRASALPEADENGVACGAGVDVVIIPSAAQLNHDMPIPGVWPKR